MDYISRILMLPMLIVATGIVLVTPLLILISGVALFTESDLQFLFGLLFFLGMWPLLLSWVHGALFVEHFITRSIAKTFVDEHNMLPDQNYLKLSIWAGRFLARALHSYGPVLDAQTLRRGHALLKRHIAITRFVWPGMALAVIGMIGVAVFDPIKAGAGA